MNSSRISQHINAPRADVYRALLDSHAIAKWKVPDGMTCHVHSFDARKGGSFRISLTYYAPAPMCSAAQEMKSCPISRDIMTRGANRSLKRPPVSFRLDFH